MSRDVYHIAENNKKNSSLCGANICNLVSFVSASAYYTNCDECKELQEQKEEAKPMKRRYKYKQI